MLRKKSRKEKETYMGGKKERKKRQDKAKEVLTIENKIKHDM